MREISWRIEAIFKRKNTDFKTRASLAGVKVEEKTKSLKKITKIDQAAIDKALQDKIRSRFHGKG